MSLPQPTTPLITGFHVITPGKHPCPLFQPTAVCSLMPILALNRNSSLVTASMTHASCVQNTHMSCSDDAHFHCQHQHGQHPGMPPLSTHLRVGDITVATTLTDTLSPTATYKIVLLPMALLIPFGIDNTAKYVINEATVYILDTSIAGGFFRARHITG